MGWQKYIIACSESETFVELIKEAKGQLYYYYIIFYKYKKRLYCRVEENKSPSLLDGVCKASLSARLKSV